MHNFFCLQFTGTMMRSMFITSQSPETKARAQLIKELSDNEEQLELLLESKRVAAAVLFRTSYILLKTLRTARYVLRRSIM